MNTYSKYIKPILFGIAAIVFLISLIISVVKVTGSGFDTLPWIVVLRLAAESITFSAVVDWVGIKFLE
jgi:hypothetical protein